MVVYRVRTPLKLCGIGRAAAKTGSQGAGRRGGGAGFRFLVACPRARQNFNSFRAGATPTHAFETLLEERDRKARECAAERREGVRGRRAVITGVGGRGNGLKMSSPTSDDDVAPDRGTRRCHPRPTASPPVTATATPADGAPRRRRGPAPSPPPLLLAAALPPGPQ